MNEKSIKASVSQSTNERFYGNKDKSQRYSLPVAWIGSIVIRESVEVQIGGRISDVAEIPSSVMLKPFDKTLFDKHIEQGMFHGRKVEILHDPR